MTISEIKRLAKEKLAIDSFNEIQNAVVSNYNKSGNDMIILAPTGSGKTLSYISPVLTSITDSATQMPQAIVIAPTRELVIQITSVARAVSGNIKITECYGGHKMDDEVKSLAAGTDIVITTPMRLIDHLTRDSIDLKRCKIMVLDEFDKLLELGFEESISKITKRLPSRRRTILTSATDIDAIPSFLRLNSPTTLSFLTGSAVRNRLTVKLVNSPDKDKLATLLGVLNNIAENSRAIVFLNFRDAAMRTYEYLLKQHLPVGVYIGSMEQIEREKALEMFNNGTFKILVSTDLASRGLDIAEVEHVIHYHLPINQEAYTHRNGRTARQYATGTIHIIKNEAEQLPEYITIDAEEELRPTKCGLKAESDTLFFSAGKKEKISKGDVVGFIVNKAGIPATQIGTINSHDHYTLAAVPRGKASEIIKRLQNEKIKNMKVRITIAIQILQ